MMSDSLRLCSCRSKSPTVDWLLMRVTAGATLISASRYVTTDTVKKIVLIPIANYLYFFRRSVIT